MICRLAPVAVCLLAAVVCATPNAAAQEGTTGEPLGTVSGTVIDDSSGEPLIDAGVEVVGRNRTARTGIDGRFSIRVEPGTYEVRVYAPLYRSVRLQGVLVRPNQVTTADVALASAGQAGIDVVEVVALKKATEAAQLVKRQKSTEVRDTISAEAMKKAGGGDAADIVARAPSIVVKDDKYINIRGLQERYTSALLNNSRLPSTDPQRRVIPLDLFPAGFLDALSIVKSYTPNLPGDFSGGLVELELRDFPDSLTYGLGVSTGANNQSTGREFNTYRGSALDSLGFGTTFRELAAGTPGNQNQLDKEGIVARARLGRQFRDIWAVDTVDAPPNFGANASVGNRYGPFGFQLAATYGNQYRHRRNEIANNFVNLSEDFFNASEIGINDSVLYDRSTFSTKLGGIATASYDIADNQRINFRSLYNRSSNDQVFLGQGFRRNASDIPVRQQTFRYTMEELYWLQLAGEHRWSWVNLDWRTVYSRGTQKEPDTRFFTQVGQVGNDPNPFTYVTDSLSGTRLFNDLQEWLSDSAADLTFPFTTGLPYTDIWSGLTASFKTGVAYSFRDRNFVQRRFRYRPTSGTDNSDLIDPTLPPQELFAPQNIGVGGFDFVEETQPRDNYTVSQEIAGVYGMFEIPIIRDRLRVIGGTRYEYSYIKLNSRDDLNKPQSTINNNIDPLSGVSVVLSPRPDMNVRFAYSHTVSRPDFRELSPALYLAPLGEIQTQGNPFLVEASINSYDLRWEWFFSPLEIVSFGVFHKLLDKPIEETLLPQGSNPLQSWANAQNARLTGFEFEGRKDLGFLAPRLTFLGSVAPQLRNVSLQASVTYANSNVNTPRGSIPGLQTVRTIQTNTQRPLQGQAPFIVNAAFDYTHPDWGTVRLAYNTAGNYIVLVGANGLPDVSQDRRNQLDLVLIKPLKDWTGLPITASINVENITNERVNWTIGRGVTPANEGGPTGKIAHSPGVQSGTVKRFTTGVGFGLSLSYSF